MLTKLQHRHLKAMANQLKALYQLGKNDLGPSHIELFNNALTARELIKVSVLTSVVTPVKEIAEEVARLTEADLIETKGRTFVLYKRNLKAPKIKLPQ